MDDAGTYYNRSKISNDKCNDKEQNKTISME